MFHWKDGWFFSRTGADSVVIEHRVYGTEKNELGELMYTYDVKVLIDANSWASIISSVSAGGEVDGRFYTALAFHNSKGQIAINQLETEKR